jgi:hypothetical protein
MPIPNLKVLEFQLTRPTTGELTSFGDFRKNDTFIKLLLNIVKIVPETGPT